MKVVFSLCSLASIERGKRLLAFELVTHTK